MGMFIEVKISPDKCLVEQGCVICAEACPIGVFISCGRQMLTLHQKEDECTLCELCVQRCPAQAIRLLKKYLA